MERKDELIAVLEKERDMLRERWGRDPQQHNEAIAYLKTGEYKEASLETNELLEACVEDYDTMILDYLGA